MADQPTLLTQPFAENGDKNVIPNTTVQSGAFSQDKGFPAETSLPLGAGGVAPSRQDFNGAFNMLSRLAFYQQKGWTWHFDNTQDYYAGCIVIDDTDGKMYRCINDVSAGGSVPSADVTNWIAYDYLHRLLQRNTAYNVGDIVYSPHLGGGYYLECTTAGTTDSVEPDLSGGGISLSPEDTITDGTVTWTLRWHKETWSLPIYSNPVVSSTPITANPQIVTLTAPADGMFFVVLDGIVTVTGTALDIIVRSNSNVIAQKVVYNNYTAGGYYAGLNFYAKKGDVFAVSCSYRGSFSSVSVKSHFYYSKNS